MSWKKFKRAVIPREISEFTEEVEDFVRPVTDPIRSGIAKVIPNEAKPWLSTIASMYAPIPGGPLASFFTGAGMDAFAQKLMTDPDDEDTDVDWLKSAMSGVMRSIAAEPAGVRNIEGTAADHNLIETTKDGSKFYKPKTNLSDTGILSSDLSKATDLASRLNTNTAQLVAAGSKNTGVGNYMKSDFLRGLQQYTGATGGGEFKDMFTRKGWENLYGANYSVPAFSDINDLWDVAGATGKTLTGVETTQLPSQVRDAAAALQAAEAEYAAYLDQLDADTRASIEADRSARIAAYKKYMGLAGYSEEEINQALINAGYLEEGGTVYAANGGRIGFNMGSQVEGPHRGISPFPSGRGLGGLESLLRELSRMKDAVNDEYRARIRERARIPSGANTSKYESMLKELSRMKDAVNDEQRARIREGARRPIETAYAANGGRIGFNMGTQEGGVQTGGKTDSMGIGNYVETEKIRSRWMDKVERMLQHKRANMQTNDPGLMRFMNAAIPGGEGFYTKEEMAFPDMEKRYEQTIQQMERDQANDDWKMMERTKNQVGGYLDMLDNRYANMKKGGRINYNMGTRRTPEGDPISPDVPAGMQMDLRGGGFIPLGTKPRADDVPAMVGLNEFVLNDRAVAGIGKMITGRPDPRAGAKALYDLQNQMEATV